MKILSIVLGFFLLIAVAFAIYAVITIENYKQLRAYEVSGIVAFESERVNRDIAEMERNAVDLALSGRHFYLSSERTSDLGITILEENFRAFDTAVGGGIWYEPFALETDKQRVCYYAFYDSALGIVRHDPTFETEQYDYHTQVWYLTITEGLNELQKSGERGKYGVVWTAPYYDEAGTNALMTTVGAGIYSRDERLVGISTVDWDIQSMVDRLTSLHPTPNSFVLLASTRDDYIISNTTANDNDLAGRSLSAIPWYSEPRITERDNVDIGSFKDNGVDYMSFSRVFDNGWLFSIQIPVNEIFAEVETLSDQFTAIIAVSFVVLLLLTAYLLSRLINRPLHKLTSGVAGLGSGDLDKKIEIQSKDEFGALAVAFNEMTVELKRSIDEIAQERAERERIEAELEIAAKIQTSMLPSVFPPFPDRNEFDLYATMQPAKEVGGDFYDFFLINDETLAVVIADVSGKGIPAALFMIVTMTLLRDNAHSGKSPSDIFKKVNNILCRNNDADMFVTAFMGYLDIPTGRFTYVNAGHNPPLIKRGSHFEQLKVKPGFILAGMEKIPYSQCELTLQPGDELYLYTDGVTEAMNNSNQLFGDLRLMEAINRSADLPLRELCKSIKREIDVFADGAEQADDITMLVLLYKGGEHESGELIIEAKAENLDAVLDFIGAKLEAAGCGAKVQTQITVCAEEIFVNIASYAYGAKAGSVTVRSAASGGEILLEFEDSGVAYNPLAKDDPDISLPVDERKIGGLGIFMVKNMVDSVQYRREDDKNILTLKKRY